MSLLYNAKNFLYAKRRTTPVVAFFAIRWLPAAPKQALPVLVLQIGAALAAMFPVWWFQW